MAPAGTALLRGDERQIDGVGDEVRLEQQALLLALAAEVFRLSGKRFLKSLFRVEHEFDVFVRG